MPSKPDLSDTLKTRRTLLSKVRRGDEEGWSRFYEFYSGFVNSAARAATLSHEEAGDVVQETMITVRKYIADFVPDANRGRFRTWLRKIVQSRIADQYRRKKRNPLAAVQQQTEEDSSTRAVNRIPNLNEIDLTQLVDGKLEQAILAEAQKLAKSRVRMEDYQAYDLFQIHELSARDVAVSLGISPATVRVRAFRVRRVVEKEMRRFAKLLEAPNRFV